MHARRGEASVQVHLPATTAQSTMSHAPSPPRARRGALHPSTPRSIIHQHPPPHPLNNLPPPHPLPLFSLLPPALLLTTLEVCLMLGLCLVWYLFHCCSLSITATIHIHEGQHLLDVHTHILFHYLLSTMSHNTTLT